MLCANINNNGHINLIEENRTVNKNLATYNELIDELCLGYFEVGHLTMVKDGVIIWNEDECEMDFIKFRC